MSRHDRHLQKFPTGAGHPVYDTLKEFPAGSGNLWPPVDLLHVARNVGKTSRQTCGARHFFGGGGDAVKHGDLDSTMTHPTREVDVHMGVDGLNFTCATCHHAGEHRILGTSYPSTSTDARLCQKCHGPSPHRASLTFGAGPEAYWRSHDWGVGREGWPGLRGAGPELAPR